MTTNKKLTTLTLYFCLIILTAFSSSTSAQYKAVAWGSVASAGTVDEADRDKVSFNLSEAFLKGTLSDQIQIGPVSKSVKSEATTEGFLNPFADNTVAVIRYNVLAVEGHNSGYYGHSLGVRACVTMSGSKVQVTMYEVDNLTGTKTIRLQNFITAASPGYQTYFNDRYGDSWLYDFKNKTYFVEAVLTRTDLRAKVGIEFIHYDNTAGNHNSSHLMQ